MVQAWWLSRAEEEDERDSTLCLKFGVLTGSYKRGECNTVSGTSTAVDEGRLRCDEVVRLKEERERDLLGVFGSCELR
jgi:hypothetical protein